MIKPGEIPQKAREPEILKHGQAVQKKQSHIYRCSARRIFFLPLYVNTNGFLCY